jgi:hypothetical protein
MNIQYVGAAFNSISSKMLYYRIKYNLVERIISYTGENMLHSYNFKFLDQKPIIVILLTV